MHKTLVGKEKLEKQEFKKNAQLNAEQQQSMEVQIQLKNIIFIRSGSHDSLGQLQKLQFFLMEESCLELVL